MKKYKIDIMPSAHKDLKDSYEWGCKQWGTTKAKQWLRQAQKTILSLSKFPERHPLAPEAEDFNIEIRQALFLRYRVLFLVSDDTINVVHVRGAYYEETEEN